MKTNPWSAEAFGEGGYKVVPLEEELEYCLKLLEQEYLIRPERYELVKRDVIGKYPELGEQIAALEVPRKWRSGKDSASPAGCTWGRVILQQV